MLMACGRRQMLGALLAIFASRVSGSSDEDDTCGGGNESMDRLSRQFVGSCSKCDLKDIVPFLNFMTSGLRVESVAFSIFDMLVLFVLLQLGGVPETTSEDGGRSNVGVFLFYMWILGAGLQFVFTFISLGLLILACFSTLLQYRDCLTDATNRSIGDAVSFGISVGAGVGLVTCLACILAHVSGCAVRTKKAAKESRASMLKRMNKAGGAVELHEGQSQVDNEALTDGTAARLQFEKRKLRGQVLYKSAGDSFSDEVANRFEKLFKFDKNGFVSKHFFLVATLSATFGGATLGCIWGAATAEAAYFAAVLPILLLHPAFISRSRALLAYFFAMTSGLNGEIMNIDVDRALARYSLVMVVPEAIVATAFIICGSTVVFSLAFFIPVAALLVLPTVLMFKGLHSLNHSSKKEWCVTAVPDSWTMFIPREQLRVISSDEPGFNGSGKQIVEKNSKGKVEQDTKKSFKGNGKQIVEKDPKGGVKHGETKQSQRTVTRQRGQSWSSQIDVKNYSAGGGGVPSEVRRLISKHSARNLVVDKDHNSPGNGKKFMGKESEGKVEHETKQVARQRGQSWSSQIDDKNYSAAGGEVRRLIAKHSARNLVVDRDHNSSGNERGRSLDRSPAQSLDVTPLRGRSLDKDPSSPVGNDRTSHKRDSKDSVKSGVGNVGGVGTSIGDGWAVSADRKGSQNSQRGSRASSKDSFSKDIKSSSGCNVGGVGTSIGDGRAVTADRKGSQNSQRGSRASSKDSFSKDVKSSGGRNVGGVGGHDALWRHLDVNLKIPVKKNVVVLDVDEASSSTIVQGVNLNPLSLFDGSLWWLPDLPFSQWPRAALALRSKEVGPFGKIVFGTALLLILSPSICLGAFLAFYTYHGDQSTGFYVNLAYRHFFALVFDATLYVPPLVLDFNWGLISKWLESLAHIPTFYNVAPELLLEGSFIFTRLASVSAFIRPIASGLATSIGRTSLIGKLAEADSGLLGALGVYRERDSASEVLIKHLKTMGFNTDGFGFGGPKVSSLQKFVIHRDDTNKVSGLLLEKLREYKNLEVINIKGCENVTSNLSSLSTCRHLKKLNCANCPKIFGSVAIFKDLEAIKEIVLSGCTKLTGKATSFFESYTHLEALHLNGCPGIEGNVKDISKHIGKNAAAYAALRKLDISMCPKISGNKEMLRDRLQKCLVTI